MAVEGAVELRWGEKKRKLRSNADRGERVLQEQEVRLHSCDEKSIEGISFPIIEEGGRNNTW